MSDRRELYRSPNGDVWFFGREPTNGRAFVIRQPNAPSGGKLSHIELAEFLGVMDRNSRRSCGSSVLWWRCLRSPSSVTRSASAFRRANPRLRQAAPGLGTPALPYTLAK